MASSDTSTSDDKKKKAKSSSTPPADTSMIDGDVSDAQGGGLRGVPVPVSGSDPLAGRLGALATSAVANANSSIDATKPSAVNPQPTPDTNPNGSDTPVGGGGLLGAIMQPQQAQPQGSLQPTTDPQELQKRTQTNLSFLQNPSTKAALLQFGMALLGGNSFGAALSQGFSAAGNVKTIQDNQTQQDFENNLATQKMNIDEEELNIKKGELGLKLQGAQDAAKLSAARQALFGAANGNANDTSQLASMSPSYLLDVAGQLAAMGDDKGAKTAVSMANAKNAQVGTNDLRDYQAAIADGSFKGGFNDFMLQKAKAGATVINGQKIAPAFAEQAVKLGDKADDMDQQARDLANLAQVVQRTPTGFSQPMTLPLRNALVEAGLANDDVKNDVINQQIMTKYQNQLALQFRNPQSGYGLTGQTSNQDLKFLMSLVPNLSNTKEANVAVAYGLLSRARLNAALAREESNYIQEHGNTLGWADHEKSFINNLQILTPQERTYLDSLHNPERPLPSSSQTKTPAPAVDYKTYFGEGQ